MKKQVLTISLLALTAMPASAAINCAVLPTCEELGYNNKTSDCDSSNVLKCPFDQTKGKCLNSGAIIGQISYFIDTNPGDEWLLTDGSFYNKNQYPELYAKIKTTFGGSGDVFRVPDYNNMDAFFKPSSYTSSSVSTGCVPNVKASWPSFYEDYDTGWKNCTGAMKCTEFAETSNTTRMEQHGKDVGDGYVKREFDASRNNSIFSDYCYYPKPNYIGMPTFIYAGKKVTTAPSAATAVSSCAQYNYLYTDGTCSSSYTSGKTVLGIVDYVSKGSNYTTIEYIFGYDSTSLSNGICHNAEKACKQKGASLESHYTPLKWPTLSTSQYVARNINTSYKYCSYSSSRPYTCTSSSCKEVASGTVETYGYFYCSKYIYFRN